MKSGPMNNGKPACVQRTITVYRLARNGLRGDAMDDLLEADFGPASKSAIKCRIRSALTQAEAAIAIATSLHQ